MITASLPTMQADRAQHIEAFLSQIKLKSDKLINYFLPCYFVAGLLLAFFYDTWDVALGVGSLSIIAYYSVKFMLPDSNMYQYVLSTVFGIFMAQYIYQMHGMFEMHFVAFIGSAILITYQNWKLQIPIVLVVIVHHGLFGYLQYVGFDKIYFTQLDYMDLQTFGIHIFLAATIFFICGLWAHHFKKYSERHIEQTYDMGMLRQEKAQREALTELSNSLKASNARLNEAQQMARIGSWTWDIASNHVSRSDEFYNILERDATVMNGSPESYLQWLHEDDREAIDQLVHRCVAGNKPFSYEARAVMPDGRIKTIFAQGRAVCDAAGKVVKMSGTIQDITERKLHEQALERTNQDLIKSNHELDKFVYSVSHDLRAPLLSMQGIVEITEDYTEEELTGKHMKMLKGSIGRLDNFIGDILNYSRNARGEISLVNIDFQQVLSDIRNDLKFMTPESKKVDIQFEIDQQGDFYSDNGRLRIVINNLIANSIRYHNPLQKKPYVKVTARTTESSSCIEIEDNGIGIPVAYHEKIFEMFYRVSENSTGSGLGLYIVKETVGKLKGDISMESYPGQGTKFTLNLPNLYYQ